MARSTNKYASLNFNEIYEKKLASTITTTNSSSGRYLSSPAFSSAAHPGKSYSSASSRSHGMLLLSRPSPKPLPKTQPAQVQTRPQKQPHLDRQPKNSLPLSSPSPMPKTPPPTSKDQPRADPNSISLRPQGKSGPGPLISSPVWSANTVLERESELPQTSPKNDKFVPPHLRPGFAAKEGRPETPPGGGRGGFRHGGLGLSPNRYAEDCERPKSGGGPERTMGRRGTAGEVGGRELYPDGLLMQNRRRSGGTRPGSSG